MKDNKNQIAKREHDESYHLKKIKIYGTDGSNAYWIKTNASGELIVNV